MLININTQLPHLWKEEHKYLSLSLLYPASDTNLPCVREERGGRAVEDSPADVICQGRRSEEYKFGGKP